MNFTWNDFIRRFHNEPIRWPASVFYNLLSKNEIFQRHYELVAQDILTYCKSGKILDIGTGPGWLLVILKRLLPQIEAHGIDISPAMIEKAGINLERNGLSESTNLKTGSASELPYPNNSFDAVVSTGSIHHWGKPHQCLAEVFRVLKNDRYALIYDIVKKTPGEVIRQMKKDYGGFRMALMWLHSFEEPFYDVREFEKLSLSTPFEKGETHFTGALCCLVLKKS